MKIVMVGRSAADATKSEESWRRVPGRDQLRGPDTDRKTLCPAFT